MMMLVSCVGRHCTSTVFRASPSPYGELLRVAVDSDGKTGRGIIGAIFAIYAEQPGGAPLWIEAQHVSTGAKFAVELGAGKTRNLCKLVGSLKEPRADVTMATRAGLEFCRKISSR